MKTSLILVCLIGVATATNHPPGCAYDSCFWKDQVPQEWKPALTKFCKALVGKQCSTTASGTQRFSTVVQTLSPTTIQQTLPQSTVLQTVQDVTTVLNTVATTDIQTEPTVCVVSTDAPDPVTSTYFAHFTPIERRARNVQELAAEDDPRYHRRMKRDTLPDFATAGCTKSPPLQKLKDACKCFLAAPQNPLETTTIVQGGSTVVQTLPAQTTTIVETLAPQTVQITTTNVIIETVPSCTSTSTVFTNIPNPISSCGAPAGQYSSRTTGQISCTQPAVAPSGSVNAFHRIEADDSQGTVYEGCIYAGPRSITTPSGGTHQCGSSTGTSITDQTDAASQLTGFTYDGSYSASFNDYFITRIGSTQQTGNSYWGVLDNGVFTTNGGCGAQVQPGDSSLWQWDAFNLQSLLTITPQYAVVATGDPVSITVTSRSPNGGGSTNYEGATLSDGSGSISDQDGNITWDAPSAPGCYQYKVTGASVGRSNAFYLNVVSAFPATIG